MQAVATFILAVLKLRRSGGFTVVVSRYSLMPLSVVCRALGALGTVLALAGPAQAQKTLPPPIKFGTLTKADLADATAPADTAAPAEILCDFGQSKIVGAQDGFELLFERTTRVRIRRRTGYDYATVRVPLYHREGQREKLQQLKGVTYNLAGDKLTKTPLRTEAVFSKKLSEHLDEYAFTLPDVREGSVVEYTYTIRSEFLFNLQDWQFQHDVPVRWSEYRIILPSFFRYKEISRTYVPFAFNQTDAQPYTTAYREAQRDSYGRSLTQDNAFSITTVALHRRWVLQNAPALREEAYMTSLQDYRARVDFELERIQFSEKASPTFVVGSWAEIEKELLKHENFGQYLERASPLTAQATALRATHPDAAARAAAVRTLVMQAVGYEGLNSMYARTPPRKVCEQRRGNAAEVNLLLVRSLRDAGLDAQPLLLSTRANGQVQTELPVVSQFNYVVAHLGLPGGRDVLLDATDWHLPPTLLPAQCLGGQGRLLGPAGRWVPLSAAQPHTLYTQATWQLDAHGALGGTVRHEYAGYAAPAARQAGTAALRQQWQKARPDWTVETAETTGADQLDKPLAFTLAAHLPGADAPAATLYVRPLQHLAPAASPFRAEERRFPVDLEAPHRAEYTVTLTLPPGYTAATLPADVNLTLPNNGGRFVYGITQPTPTTLRIASRLLLDKTRYPASEYAALRELHAKALAKFAEPIVVQKR